MVLKDNYHSIMKILVYNPEDGDRNCEECEGGVPPNGGHKSAAEDLPNSH
jgi:hypothetical protein